MSQPSILNFFKARVDTSIKNGSEQVTLNKQEDQREQDETETIISKSRKRSRVIESDSEDEKVNESIKTSFENKKSLKTIEKDDEQTELKENKSNDDKSEDEEDKKDDVFIVKPEEYNPSISKYHAIRNACWKKNEKVPYMALVKTFNEIESVSSRLKMIEILGNYFWSVKVLSPNDLIPSVYLSLNKLCPDYEGIELGMGESLIIKALAEATGRKSDQIKADIEKKGDIGLVAESSRCNQRLMMQPPMLTVSYVFTKLKEVAMMSGHSSTSKKVDKIKTLLVACRECEARYLVRSLTGKLRIGLAEQSLLVALARCVILSQGVSTKNEESFKNKVDDAAHIIKTAYCQCPNYDKVITTLIECDLTELPNRCQLEPGIPLKPMLAHPTKDISEILKRFESSEFTCEYKYDGERAQIHIYNKGDKREMSIYSRNQENNTSKYPDILSRIANILQENVYSCILDCEAVAWDLETKQILPFQVLSTRKRKDAKEEDIKVKVCLFAFDLLFLNGMSLVSECLRKRRQLLRENFIEIDDEFMFAKSKDFKSIDNVEEFLEESIKGKCEGLMVKALDQESAYEIAKRSRSWLKLKKDYLDGVGDTIDVVVIGGYYGKGKRTGNFGGYLVAVYDEENEEFQSICKLGTGFKDEDLDKHSAFLKEHQISGPKVYYNIDDSIKPDVWFDAVQVWEIKCADLSISPIYSAAIGLVEPDKGVSLRFPRFIRIRDDKNPEDATSSSQIADMYNSQEQIKQSRSDDKND